MRLLRVRVRRRVDAGLVRDGLRSVQLGGLGAGRADGLAGQRRRVGAHIGDESALVQALGDAHGLARAEAELAARLLDEARRDERSGRTTGVGLGLDARHREVGRREPRRERAGHRRRHVGDAVGLELPPVVEIATRRHPLAVDAGQPRLEGASRVRSRRRLERGAHVPELGGAERHALALAVDDEPKRDRLDAPRAQAARDLAPQDRGHLVAVEAVEDAAGLLRLDELHVDVAGVVERAGDSLRGDLVEGEPLDGDLGLEHLEEVPRDRLALAVLIGREQDLGRVLEARLDLGDDLLLLGRDHVVRLEPVLDVDGELAERPLALARGHLGGLGKVANVPD